MTNESRQLSLLKTVPDETATGYVYYATDMCNIKIGHSRTPRRRGGELKVDILMTLTGGQLDERRHQRMWKRHRIGTSEWFRADPELLLWLDLHIERDTYRAAILQRLIYSVLRQGSAAA